MRQNYKWFIDRMISKYEGGYSNDAGDPGGPTRYGITYIDAAEFRGVSSGSMYDKMRTFPLSEAEEIYRRKYAVKTRFDDLNSGLDATCIDYSVNSGVARTPLVLSRILGLPTTQVMTDAIVYTANKKDPKRLIDDICDERLRFMKAIKGGASWARFGRGWQARVDDLRRISHNLVDKPIVSGGSGADIIPFPDQKKPEDMGKATNIDPKTRKAVIKGGGGVGGGLSVGTGVWYQDPIIVAGVVVGCVVVAGIAYYEVVRHQNKLQQIVHI